VSFPRVSAQNRWTLVLSEVASAGGGRDIE